MQLSSFGILSQAKAYVGRTAKQGWKNLGNTGNSIVGDAYRGVQSAGNYGTKVAGNLDNYVGTLADQQGLKASLARGASETMQGIGEGIYNNAGNITYRGIQGAGVAGIAGLGGAGALAIANRNKVQQPQPMFSMQSATARFAALPFLRPVGNAIEGGLKKVASQADMYTPKPSGGQLNLFDTSAAPTQPGMRRTKRRSSAGPEPAPMAPTPPVPNAPAPLATSTGTPQQMDLFDTTPYANSAAPKPGWGWKRKAAVGGGVGLAGIGSYNMLNKKDPGMASYARMWTDKRYF